MAFHYGHRGLFFLPADSGTLVRASGDSSATFGGFRAIQKRGGASAGIFQARGHEFRQQQEPHVVRPPPHGPMDWNGV